MTCQSGVIRFDIDLHILLEAVLEQKAVNGGGVEVILMLGRLVRFGLDENRALESDPVLVVNYESEESAHLVELSFEIGVQQGVIAFTASPHDVVLAPEALRRIQAPAN